MDTDFSPEYDSSYEIVTFKGVCLKQKNLSFLHKNVVNLYISHTLDKWSKDLDTNFTLSNCLFVAVNLTKNADPDKSKYSGYGLGFDSCSQFLWKDGSYGKNVTIFGVDNTSSVHIDSRNNNILVLGEGPIQALEDDTTTAEAKYLIDFTELGKRLVLSLHYNGNNSFLSVNTVKMYQFKVKDSEINPYPICLGNIAKDFTLDNLKKNRIKRSCKSFFC